MNDIGRFPSPIQHLAEDLAGHVNTERNTQTQASNSSSGGPQFYDGLVEKFIEEKGGERLLETFDDFDFLNEFAEMDNNHSSQRPSRPEVLEGDRRSSLSEYLKANNDVDKLITKLNY